LPISREISRGAALFVSGDTGPRTLPPPSAPRLSGSMVRLARRATDRGRPTIVTVSRDGVCQCHHLRRCRLETMCLDDIQVDEVHAAIERRLAGARRA
jgi:hypothetical protein